MRDCEVIQQKGESKRDQRFFVRRFVVEIADAVLIVLLVGRREKTDLIA